MADDVSVGECAYDDYIGAMMRIMMIRTRVTMSMTKMIMMRVLRGQCWVLVRKLSDITKNYKRAEL